MSELVAQNSLVPITDKEILLAKTNHTTPISIEGVAQATLTTNERTHICIYKVCGVLKKFQVNEDLYQALKMIFSAIQAENSVLLTNWANNNIVNHDPALDQISYQERLHQELKNYIARESKVLNGTDFNFFLARLGPVTKLLDQLQFEWRP